MQLKAILTLLVLFSVVANDANADIATGLIHWWKLDEGTGATTADSGSSPITNNLNGTPTWITGRVSNGIEFNGSSQSLQTSSTVDLSGLSAITVSFWLWQNTYSNADRIAMESGSAYTGINGGILLDPDASGGASGCTGGNFDIGIAGGAGSYNIYNLTRPSAGAWHHYVFIIYKSNASLALAYVDGVSSTLTRCHTDAMSGNFSNSTLNFMSRNNASLWNGGKMDDIRIYDRVLTASDALELYNYGVNVINIFNNATLRNMVVK